eukprot:3936166-Prymnesium_polylepis.2
MPPTVICRVTLQSKPEGACTTGLHPRLQPDGSATLGVDAIEVEASQLRHGRALHGAIHAIHATARRSGAERQASRRDSAKRVDDRVVLAGVHAHLEGKVLARSSPLAKGGAPTLRPALGQGARRLERMAPALGEQHDGRRLGREGDRSGALRSPRGRSLQQARPLNGEGGALHRPDDVHHIERLHRDDPRAARVGLRGADPRERHIEVGRRGRGLAWRVARCQVVKVDAQVWPEIERVLLVQGGPRALERFKVDD